MVARLGFIWGGVLALMTVLSGCATIPRPVPVRAQLLVSQESAGVELAVPRVDYRAYPDHVLDVATPVYVIIDNRSEVDLSIAWEDFSLGPVAGLRQPALSPRQILVQGAKKSGADAAPPGGTLPASFAAAPVLLAGPVMAAAALAAPPGGVVVPPPPTRGAAPPPAPYVQPPTRFYGGPSYYLGAPYLGADPYFWGYSPYYYGYPFDWGLYSYTPRPRGSIIRMALQTGILPRGSRSAGFLYFPPISAEKPSARRGMQLILHWDIRDAPGRNLRGQINVPLELDAAQ